MKTKLSLHDLQHVTGADDFCGSSVVSIIPPPRPWVDPSFIIQFNAPWNTITGIVRR